MDTMLPIGCYNELVGTGMETSVGDKSVVVRANRSHSEAERRRRQRINGHLATLRTLLPSTHRMDKATLLGEVVRQVRELRGRAGEAALMAPGEGDEVRVESREERVRAWVCCADRPGLMGELNRALGSVRARAVRAEMATVAGRTRSVLELELAEVEGEEGRSALQDALRSVLMGKKPGSNAEIEEKYKRPRVTNLSSTTL